MKGSTTVRNVSLHSFIAPVLIGLCVSICTPVAAEDNSQGNRQGLKGATDESTGSATRAILNEQARGINRAETEPYRAEFAGKAYRAYADSVGKSDASSTPQSQLSTLSTK